MQVIYLDHVGVKKEELDKFVKDLSLKKKKDTPVKPNKPNEPKNLALKRFFWIFLIQEENVMKFFDKGIFWDVKFKE